MSNPYTKPSISGYNSSPPADDGTETASNEVKWQTHLDKIGGPLKTYIDAINDNIYTALSALLGNAVASYSGATSLSESDQGKLIKVTGTTTITLPSAPTVGTNWTVLISNRDTSATVTVDGNGSETVNGETSIPLFPGQSALLISNGTNFESVTFHQTPKFTFQTFDTSGDNTWTKPTGCKLAIFAITGGGGGGGSSYQLGSDVGSTWVSAGGNGASAPTAIKFVNVVGYSSLTVHIGAGGTGSTTQGTNGGDGGDSYVDDGSSHLVTSGGGGGGTAADGPTYSKMIALGGAAGTSTNADFTIAGHNGPINEGCGGAGGESFRFLLVHPGASSLFYSGAAYAYGLGSGISPQPPTYPSITSTGASGQKGSGGQGGYAMGQANYASQDGGDGGDGYCVVIELY